MQNEIGINLDALPAATFKWVDRFGESHPVSEMATRHLFYALRMLWNHMAPSEWRLEPYRRYQIDRPLEYIRYAIPALYQELLRRSDLARQWRHELDYMRNCFNGLQRVEARANEIDHSPTAPVLDSRHGQRLRLC